jgi:hypothetical protein
MFQVLPIETLRRPSFKRGPELFDNQKSFVHGSASSVGGCLQDLQGYERAHRVSAEALP